MAVEARSKTQELSKIRSFTGLKVWQVGHKLVLNIYKITKSFPKDELFALVSQIRRAAISITSNIAEGFSRSTFNDKVRFYYMALGSLTEVQNQLIIARDLGYLPQNEFQHLAALTVEISKMTNGLIKKSKSQSALTS